MSGIFGVFRKDSIPAGERSLRAMNEAMSDWRADRVGLWNDGPTAVGCRLLEITPESQHERPPTRHPAAPGLVGVADAWLDNREALCDALGVPVDERATQADAALLLLAYSTWGERCVDRLEGIFAFAIWDERRERLFCARDHMGVRPFLFFDGPEQFVFASDVRAVLAVEGVPEELDEEAALAKIVRYPTLLLDRALFEGIRKLRAGRTLTVSRQGRVERTYWEPTQQPELRLASDEAYADHVREQLERAVTRTLRTAYPVGAHLSGGLDSSTVTVLAARGLRARGRALAGVYSWSPPPDDPGTIPDDERALVEAVCAQEGLRATYTDLTPEKVAAFMARDIRTKPTSTLLAEIEVQRDAEQRGIRVLLSGWGGDEGIAFNGRGYLAELTTGGRWLTALRESRAYCREHGGSVMRELLHHGVLPAIPLTVLRWMGRDESTTARRVRETVPDGWSRLDSRARTFLRLKWLAGREQPGAAAMRSRLFKLGHLYLRVEDWATEGARRGLVYRFPLLDPRIVELSFSLPSRFYYQNGWRRHGLRLTVDGVLPSQVQWNACKVEEGYRIHQKRALAPAYDVMKHTETGLTEGDSRLIVEQQALVFAISNGVQ